MSAGLGTRMLRTHMKGLGKAQRFMKSRTGDKKTKHFVLVGFLKFIFLSIWGHFVKE